MAFGFVLVGCPVILSLLPLPNVFFFYGANPLCSDFKMPNTTCQMKAFITLQSYIINFTGLFFIGHSEFDTLQTILLTPAITHYITTNQFSFKTNYIWHIWYIPYNGNHLWKKSFANYVFCHGLQENFHNSANLIIYKFNYFTFKNPLSGIIS